MKKLIASLVILNCSINLFAQNQQSIPEAPLKVEFANVLIELNTETQKMVNEEIVKILTPQNKYLDQKLERIQWYFPIIERILEEEDIPQDFKYLAVMESSLLPDAISTSNAVGYWQFKDATGKDVGLRIDNSIDERKNIQESTKAAALYLKRNNLIYKNWISSMLTFNLGLNGAAENIPAEWTFASEIKFGLNTHPYLIRALAHKIAIEHRINRLKNSTKKLIEYPSRGKSLEEIASELNIDINELIAYNSFIYSLKAPLEKNYSVLILSSTDDDGLISKIQKNADAGTMDVGFPQLKRITMVSTSPDSPIFYEINGKKGILAQPGNEAAQMASKAKVKISSFLKYNDMTDKDIAKEGQVYYLQRKNKKAKVPYYTSIGEQTLWDVSQMYGVRLKKLKKYNRIDKVQILQAGRVLWLQKTRPKRTPIEIIKLDTTITPQKAFETEKPTLPFSDNISSDDIIFNTPQVSKQVEEIIPIPKETPVINTPTYKPVKEVIKDKPLSTDDPVFTGSKKTPSITPTYKEPISNPIDTKEVYIVKQGETLYSISRKFNVTVSEIRKLNNLGPNDPLLFNQKLIVKSTPSNSTPRIQNREKVVVTTPSNINNATQSHTVKTGETLYSISKQYNVEVSEIKKWNNLTDNSISVGQKLQIANSNLNRSTTTNPTISQTTIHKVLTGETLYSISRKYNVSVSDIKVWNNMNDNSISIGQNIKIRR